MQPDLASLLKEPKYFHTNINASRNCPTLHSETQTGRKFADFARAKKLCCINFSYPDFDNDEIVYETNKILASVLNTYTHSLAVGYDDGELEISNPLARLLYWKLLRPIKMR